MTYNPDTLKALGSYWVGKGGVNLGVVGDTERHCRGYHLGRDRIYGKCACRPKDICEPGLGDKDYSVQHPRDRAGLTNAASAIDLGKLNGSLAQLYRFSEWLVARCQAKAPGTEDVREVIYWSVANQRVQRYSGIDGLVHWGPGNGDLSHKTHTHISFHRDSESRDKRPLFIPYFTTVPDTGTGDDMLVYANANLFPGGPRIWRVKAGTTLNGYDPAQPGKVIKTSTFSADSWARADAEVYVTSPVVPRGGPFLRVIDGAFKGLLIVKALVSLDPAPPQPTQEQLDAAVAEVNKQKARAESIKAKVATHAADVADD